MNYRSRLLRQEVNELTDLLRHDKSWADLRQALEKKGLRVDKLLLVGFMENETGGEWGAVITDALQIFEYRRNTSSKASNRFTRWREVTNVDELAEIFAAAKTGLKMARSVFKKKRS